MEKIDSSGVTAVYSVGDYRDERGKWIRIRNGKIKNGEIILTAGPMVLTLTPKNQNSIYITWERENISHIGILERKTEKKK